MRTLLAIFLTVAAAPVCAQVADPADVGDSGDTVAPKTSYPVGNAELVARNMLVAMRLEQKQQDLCWQMGCLVIVNESQTYQVTDFRLREKRRDGSLVWGSNQFGQPLQPRRATFRFKSGGADTCAMPVKFVMRKPKTHDKFEFETTISLCSSPHRDSLVRIRAVTPEVRVGS